MHENSWSLASETYLEAAAPGLLKNALCLAPMFCDAKHRTTYNFSSKHFQPKYTFYNKFQIVSNCTRVAMCKKTILVSLINSQDSSKRH